MEPTASNVCMTMEDSDNELSLNDSLLNDLPSMSYDDNDDE